MLHVPALLDSAAAIRLGDRHTHRLGHLVGVEDHLTTSVSCGATNRLDERPRAAKEAFLIRIKDCDERHLWEVDSLAQQVDPHDHVKDAETEVAQDLDPLECVNFAVEIADADPRLLQVRGELLCHPLRQGCDDHTLTTLDALLDTGHQIVNLPRCWDHRDLRIHHTGRSDELLNDAVLLRHLVVPWRRGDIDHLSHARLKLFKGERTIIKGAR